MFAGSDGGRDEEAACISHFFEEGGKGKREILKFASFALFSSFVTVE